MDLKNETRTIDDKQVTVTCFPARLGLKLQVKLVKTVFPLMGLAGDTGNPDDSQMINKLATSLSGLDDKNIETLVLQLLSSTIVDNKTAGDAAQFDFMFSGEFGLLFDVLKFVLEVNYSSFLSKIGITLLQKGDGPKVLTPKSNMT
jgi:hypothetical protein